MISIIVPVYNAENYLNRCINCVLNQDYSDWELILVNDGSSDSSRTICDEAVKKHANIKTIHQANQGASIARRVGIENSIGEYLVFIDCDDEIETNFLSTLYFAITSTNTNIAACGIIKHKETEKVELANDKSVILINQNEFLDRFFHYEFWGYVDKIYHRQVFSNLFIPKYTINEDYVVMLQILQREEKIAYTPSQLYHYYIHENSLSHQKLSKRALEEFYNKKWGYEFCKEKLPTYKKHAEAQVAETCIKLLRMIKNHGTPNDYKIEYDQMKGFLKSHSISILFNSKLLLGLKIEVIKLLLC